MKIGRCLHGNYRHQSRGGEEGERGEVGEDDGYRRW